MRAIKSPANNNKMTLVGNNMKIVIISTEEVHLNCYTIKVNSIDYSLEDDSKTIYTKTQYEQDLTKASTSVKVKVDNFNRFICIL